MNMEIDIDDLETIVSSLEKELLGKKNQGCNEIPKDINGQIPAKKCSVPKDIEAIDDLDVVLKEIKLDTESNENYLNKKILSSDTTFKKSQGKKLKCMETRCGGTRYTSGQCLSKDSKEVCNDLRCISCDFKVLFFDHQQWSNAVDYLFFRNNVPDKVKLSSKLYTKKDVRAYCCQCSWLNATEIVVLGSNALKWVCSGHLDSQLKP